LQSKFKTEPIFQGICDSQVATIEKVQKRKRGKNSVFLRAKFHPSLKVIEISKENSDLLYMVLGFF
jgi:hypothetical protein